MEKVFRKVGLSLPVDGSADHELDTKGFAKIEIGDWRSQTDDPLELEFADVDLKDCDTIEYVADGE